MTKTIIFNNVLSPREIARARLAAADARHTEHSAHFYQEYAMSREEEELTERYKVLIAEKLKEKRT